MTSLLSRAARIAGACAVLAFSVFTASSKPAEACFMTNAWIDDCTVIYNQICSYNNDGTGGYYVAHAGVISVC